MNASPAQLNSATPPRPFARRIVTALSLVILGGAAGAGFWHLHGRQHLGDLERQLVLAQRQGDAGAVGEIARRIALVDERPERLLALGASLLHVRLFEDLETTLAAVERLAPERGHEVVRLRAQAAAAKGEWDASIALWEQYLSCPAVTVPEKVAGLDELVAILLRQARWEQARARIDSRLALADSVAARLVRAHIEIRLRQWAAAREDFRHLQATSPADAAVRDVLPAWERIERAQAEVQAADEAVNAAPTALPCRLERALLCARLGLWQNAADDLLQAATAFPSARMPGLFGAALGLHPFFAKREAVTPEGDFARALPWLAPSRTMSWFLERTDGQWAQWRQLAALDGRLTAAAAELDRTQQETARLRAERAQVICDLRLPDAALNEALSILKSTPNFLPAQRVEIAALLASGEVVRAGSAVDRALGAHAAELGAPDAELQRLAGLVWQAQGKHVQAVDALTACLERERRVDLLRARAKSLRQLQRFAEAAQDVAAAEALEAVAAKEASK